MPDNDVAETKAITLLCGMVVIYFIPIYDLIKYLNNNTHLNKIFVSSILFSIIALHYFVVLYKNYYLNIYEEFQNDDDYRKKYMTIAPTGFIMTGIVALIADMVLH